MSIIPDPANPFEYQISLGKTMKVVQTCDVHDRLEKVKGFGLAQLEKVVVLPGCQKTVVLAAERRIRNLRKRGEA